MSQQTFKSITVTATILVIACLGLGYFFARPQWDQYSLNKANVQILKDNKQRLTEALNNLQSFLNNFQTHQPQTISANLALPNDSPSIADFMANIGSLAQQSGVALSNFSIEPTTSAAQAAEGSFTIHPMAFDLDASGSFLAFKDFVLRIESHLRVVDIGQITLKGDENGNIKYQMRLQTYYQK